MTDQLKDGDTIKCKHCGHPRKVIITRGARYVEFCANRSCYDDAYELLPISKKVDQPPKPVIGLMDFDI